MRFRTLLLSVALIAPLAVAGESVREADRALRHAENDLQPHAHGGIAIRSSPDFQRFSLVVEGVSEDATLRVLMGDFHGSFSEVATLPAGLSRREFVATTLGDGHLPLGVETAAGLSGRGVNVVDGESHLILFGEVPHFEVERPAPPPAPIVTRAWFLRPDSTPFPEARGLTVVSRTERSEGIRWEADRLAPETEYGVFIGDGAGAVLFGELRTNGLGGGELRRETEHGEPFGDALPRLADLYGQRVEIRDHDGNVLLYGHVPEAEDEHDVERVREHAEAHDEDSGADVRVVCEIRPDRGHERFRMDMHDLPREREHHDDDHHDADRPDGDHHDGDDSSGGDDDHHEGDGASGGDHHEGGDDPSGGDHHDGAAGGDSSGDDRPDGEARRARRRPMADVFMDDGTGNLEQVASVRIDRRGNARLRYNTRRGRTLPLGAATLRELSGRAFEVRVNGVRAVGGNLPNM